MQLHSVRLHSVKKWILPMSTGACNTTHLRSLLAPLIKKQKQKNKQTKNCFFNDWLTKIIVGLFFSLFFFSLGAATGYLMQRFFISLHFLYHKGLVRMKCTLAEVRNERKSCLAAFASIQVKSLLLSFFTWGISACMSFTSEFCAACWVLFLC